MVLKELVCGVLAIVKNNELDIRLLQHECVAGRIKWTTHILERMQERNISPTDVIQCIVSGTIIEQYPQAYPYPACLILGTSERITHIP